MISPWLRLVGASHPFASRIAVLIVGRAGASLFSALWLVIAARFLPREVFGDLALILAVGGITSVIADGGYSIALNHSVARCGHISWPSVHAVIRTRLVAGLAAAFVTAGAYLAVADDRDPLVPAVFALSLLATTVHSTGTTALRGIGKVKIEAWNEVCSRLSVLIVGTTCLARGGGLLAAVIVYTAADLFSAALIGPYLRRHCKAESVAAIDPSLSLRAVAPLAVAAVAGALFARVDLWLLALLDSSLAVADYAAASRLLEAVLLPAGAISAMVLGRVSHLGAEERTLVLRRLLTSAMAIAVSSAAVLTLAGPPIVTLVYGPGFSGAATTLPVLMLSAGPAAVVLVLAPAAATAQRARFLWCVTTCLGMKVALNLALVPILGSRGAAWAAAISHVALALLLRRNLRRPSPSTVSAARKEGVPQLA